MVAEILSIGTELLLGQIVDTNAAYLARTLAALGIDVYHRMTVGDNEQRLLDALRTAAARADVIITSGGIGPTMDDLTKETIAKVFDEELVLDAESLAHVEGFFQRRGVTMPERNRKQALIYRNGRPIPNPNGTAPGALLEKDGKIVISLPGPPREMVPMVENHVVPLLAERQTGQRMFLRSRVLRFIGIGESALEERVQDLMVGTNPTIAPYAHVGEVHLRVTSKGPDEAEIERLLDGAEAQIRERVGQFIYATNDVSLEQAVVDGLRQAGRTLAVAESCTGGLLAQRLTSVPHSSEAFPGGIVSYQVPIKERVLGVPSERIEQYGVVSAEVAEAMAERARQLMETDIGIGITGWAGPTSESPGQPVGLVYIAIATLERTRHERNEFWGVREDIRYRATQVALAMVWRAVRG